MAALLAALDVRGDAGGLGVQVDAGLAALSRQQLVAKVTGGEAIVGVKAAVLTGETAADGGRLHIYVPREQAGGASQYNAAFWSEFRMLLWSALMRS